MASSTLIISFLTFKLPDDSRQSEIGEFTFKSNNKFVASLAPSLLSFVSPRLRFFFRIRGLFRLLPRRTF